MGGGAGPLGLPLYPPLGDLNLPDINWDLLTIESSQYPHRLNERFLEFLQNCGLQQMVKTHWISLWPIDHHWLINVCLFQGFVIMTSSIQTRASHTTKRSKPVKRKIYLWNKAHVDDMKHECFKFQLNFLSKYKASSSVYKMWSDIKSTLLAILDDCVPAKMSSTRFNTHHSASLRETCPLGDYAKWRHAAAIKTLYKVLGEWATLTCS